MKFVYFLKSQKSKKFVYVGLTNNLKRRLNEHSSENSKLATSRYKPLELAGYIAIKDENKAVSLERYFKTGSGKAFLKKRILPDEARK